MSIVKNKYDSKGRRIGFWSRVSFSQTMIYEGFYVEGRRVDLWRIYDAFENEFCVIEKSQDIRREILYIY